MRTLYIGKNIKHLRKQKKLTQEALGALLGVKKATVSTYEIGRNFPTVEGLLKISDLFKVDLESLFFADLTGGRKKANRVEEPVSFYEGEVKRIMLGRIHELEREIRENAPDLAKRLGL